MSAKTKRRLTFKGFLVLLKDAFWAWEDDNAWRLGAAIAYFTVFSLAPLLIIVIAIAGLAFGHEAVEGEIFRQIGGLIGYDGARAIQNMLRKVYLTHASLPETFFGLVLLIFGATAVFVQLRDALNTIWYIGEKPISSIKSFVKARIIAFTAILVIGFLLLVSLVISAILAALSRHLSMLFPGLGIVKTTDFLVSFGFITVLFALIFKILPNAEIKWKDVWIGSALISLLFTLGKMAIGFYLGSSGIASTFGAARSLVIVMLWTFYSAQIFLFGAEFTKIYADRFGSKIIPDTTGVRIEIRKKEVKRSRKRQEPNP